METKAVVKPALRPNMPPITMTIGTSVMPLCIRLFPLGACVVAGGTTAVTALWCKPSDTQSGWALATSQGGNYKVRGQELYEMNTVSHRVPSMCRSHASP